MNLFVANISNTVKEEALKALFEEFGKVISVKIMTDSISGFPKGFGFVEMANETQALEAIKKLANAPFFGKNLVVSRARPKTF
jgi:RNA recognition motif-containing protein